MINHDISLNIEAEIYEVSDLVGLIIDDTRYTFSRSALSFIRIIN